MPSPSSIFSERRFLPSFLPPCLETSMQITAAVTIAITSIHMIILFFLYMANSSIKKPCPLGRAFYIYSGGKYANISGRNMITDFIIYSILSDWEITGRVALENNPAVVDTVTTGCFICQMRSCGTIACNIRCQLKAFKGYLRFHIYFFHRSSPLPVIDANRRLRQKSCRKHS